MIFSCTLISTCNDDVLSEKQVEKFLAVITAAREYTHTEGGVVLSVSSNPNRCNRIYTTDDYVQSMLIFNEMTRYVACNPSVELRFDVTQ